MFIETKATEICGQRDGEYVCGRTSVIYQSAYGQSGEPTSVKRARLQVLQLTKTQTLQPVREYALHFLATSLETNLSKVVNVRKERKTNQTICG